MLIVIQGQLHNLNMLYMKFKLPVVHKKLDGYKLYTNSTHNLNKVHMFYTGRACASTFLQEQEQYKYFPLEQEQVRFLNFKYKSNQKNKYFSQVQVLLQQRLRLYLNLLDKLNVHYTTNNNIV